MRIVGGARRGKAIKAPPGTDTRPTTDRVRETIFNIIAHRHPEALTGRVLDLFAGSGAMGLEALSRGASFSLFVETAPAARAAIRENCEAMGVTGCTRVWRRDATALGPAQIPPFGLVFADPPYAKGLGEAALAEVAAGGWAANGAVAVLEEGGGTMPQTIPGWQRLTARTMGRSAITLWTLAPVDGSD